MFEALLPNQAERRTNEDLDNTQSRLGQDLDDKNINYLAVLTSARDQNERSTNADPKLPKLFLHDESGTHGGTPDLVSVSYSEQPSEAKYAEPKTEKDRDKFCRGASPSKSFRSDVWDGFETGLVVGTFAGGTNGLEGSAIGALSGVVDYGVAKIICEITD